MNGFDAYKLYISLRNHFNNSSYDYFKYNGKLKLTYKSFENRKDKLFFQKLAKHKDLQNFLVSNFIQNKKLWVRDLAYSKESEEIYQNWLKRQQSLTYTFKQEISKFDSFNELFIIEDNTHPLLLRKYLSKDISLETLCILLELSGAKKYWDNKLYYDPVWDDLKLAVEKYSPFISYDKEKFKRLCLDVFS